MLNLGTETVVEAFGKTWTVGRVELRVIRAFKEWIAEQEGDPFALVERFLDKLPAEQALQMLKAAEAKRDQLRSFTLASPLAKRYLATEEGLAKLLHLLLLPKHPQVTLEDALGVLLEIGGQAAAQAIATGQGEVPRGNEPKPAS